MVRRSVLFRLTFVLAGSMLLVFSHLAVTAQESSQALTHYAQTVYSGPDRSNHIIGVLNPQAKIILDARNADTVWVLGHSTDGVVRGWMESRHLEFNAPDRLPNLPVSSEIMFIPPATFSTAYSHINLHDFPIIPVRLGQANEIFEQGRVQDRDADIVAKVGDCISDNRHFLSPFSDQRYNLGHYQHLHSVIKHFSEALAYDSLAAYDGLVTTAVLDPIFANPQVCLPGETPLRCEYRVHQPSIAIIMFGAQDLLFTPAEDFDRNLRQIVHETIQTGVIPVLSTFPGNIDYRDQTIQYNQIVVQIALEYDIPLMNLWRALEALPNHGLNTDGRHLSLPITDAGDFTVVNLMRGYTMRNLVTLQTLDAVWRGVMSQG